MSQSRAANWRPTGICPNVSCFKFLRNLVTHGILQSVRGVDGGYTLERKPADISLLEVIEAVDGPLISGAPVAEGLPHESQMRLREARRSHGEFAANSARSSSPAS